LGNWMKENGRRCIIAGCFTELNRRWHSIKLTSRNIKSNLYHILHDLEEFYHLQPFL
jgi:hypothetical protein